MLATLHGHDHYRNDMDRLFTPLRIGALELPSRVIMAPMTRSRADTDGVPLD